MNKLSKIFTFSSLMMLATSACAIEMPQDADQRFVYIGTEFGLVEPVKNKFIHTDSKTSISLKKSSMYSGKIGYSFYPQMSLEFSATHQPKYKLGYVIPEKNLGNGLSITPTPGKTKVISQVYMVNLVYDFQNFGILTPFFIGGAGVARIKVKPASSSINLFGQNKEVFKIKNTVTNCLAWQAGLGVSADVAPNFSIDFAGKLQVVHNVKINYEQLSLATQKFEHASPIKKTLGVWELGVGFTYKLPI